MSLFYHFVFYVFGLMAVVSACIFVTRKSPVAAALWLVNVMFCLSALYVLLDAEFIGVIQVLVYAGAIMVVFLFVIMLLNLGQPGQFAEPKSTGRWIAAGSLAVVVLAAVLARVPHVEPVEGLQIPPDSLMAAAGAAGAVAPLAAPLFTEYLLAFEVTSMLLLAAVVGAVVIGRRRVEEPEPLPTGAGASPGTPMGPAERVVTHAH